MFQVGGIGAMPGQATAFERYIGEDVPLARVRRRTRRGGSTANPGVAREKDRLTPSLQPRGIYLLPCVGKRRFACGSFGRDVKSRDLLTTRSPHLLPNKSVNREDAMLKVGEKRN